LASTAEEFIAEHISEHRSTFNQWCLFIGDTGMVAGALIAIVRAGHRLVGVRILLAGLGVASIGHIVDRNLVRAFRDFLTHPIWVVRGDLAVTRLLFRRSP